MATPAATRLFKNFINGEWVAPKSGKILENRNPANTDELIGVFPLPIPKTWPLPYRPQKMPINPGGSVPRQSAPKYCFVSRSFSSNAKKNSLAT